MDAIELLRHQHREVDGLFGRYHSLDRGATEDRLDVARQLMANLSMHAAIEEAAFYPTVRQATPDESDEIDHDLEEHQSVKELLKELEGCDPEDGRFDELIGKIEDDVRHHVEDEEQSLFPRVREALEDQELGGVLETLSHAVPTRPHPHEPSTPPANLVSGPVAGVLDRLRDGIRDRVDSGTV